MEIDEYENVLEEVERIKKLRQDYENKIKITENEDEIIEYKYQMAILKEELKPLLDIKYNYSREYESKKGEIARKKEEKIQKEKIYKKLYVTLDDILLEIIKNHYSINESSRELILKTLINNYNINSIKSTIYIINNLSPNIKKQLFKEVKNGNTDYLVKLFDELQDSNSIKLFNEKTQKIIRDIENRYDLSFDGIFESQFFFTREANSAYDDFSEEYYLERDKKIDKDMSIYIEY